MHIHTPAEKLTAVKPGDRIQVHSFGHVYGAQVAELKGNRLRAVWTNKSGIKYDRWLTIPGKTLRERNPLAAKTQKLRTRATALVKYGNQALGEQRDRYRERALELRCLLRDLPNQKVTVEKAAWSSDFSYYFVGKTANEDGAEQNQFGFRPREGTTVEQAVKNHYHNALHNLREAKLRGRANLVQAEELRIEANLIEKGAAK